jgi:DNA mismatch repair protein MutS2
VNRDFSLDQELKKFEGPLHQQVPTTSAKKIAGRKLMDYQRKGQEVVPLDIILTPSKRLLVISGPNAGGKSVCLKTVGALQYMLQCGMLPPVYENSHMGVFDDIFIDIGDDQSIENDLSTYSSHLRNMREFLRHGRRTSLVLVDEFGGGTEPQIGGAIAQAILKVFNDKGMWGVITTHYQNLKHLADETEGLVNGSMLYDRQQMRPLFRLSIGSPGSSFALEIARKTGLPADVLADAEEIAGSDYVNMDRYLLDIARDRRYWENKRQAIRQKEKKLEETLARYENDAETLRQHRREILAEAKEEARKILDGSNASIERAIREIRESQADRERTQAARLALQHEKADILKDKASDNRLLRKAPKARHKEPEKKPADMQKPLAVGDTVRLDGQGTPGKILDISGKNATVAFGMLKTQVKLQRLQRTLQQPSSGAREGASFVSASTVNSMRDRQLEFSREIDVRGMRADEAIQAVTYFLDDAIQFSQGQVRVLHGTGTGALRQAIRQYIDTVPGVESYRDEDVRFGGAGITVITLS